jgi:hypothetical protein
MLWSTGDMTVQIYAFFYLETGEKRYFYVGRSKDLNRRMREHQYSKGKGHEDKYERIRCLESAGTPWYFEAVETLKADDYFPDAERWHVIRLTREGHELMNMRHGSVEYRKELAEQIRDRHIRSTADVRSDFKRRAFQASKRLRRKIWIRQLKKSGISDVRADKILPRVFHRKLLAQMAAAGDGNARFKPPWTVDDFVHWVRRPLSGIRHFREFRESLNLGNGSTTLSNLT